MNYSYLADGSKLSATDGEGDGLLYRGSLIYRKTGDDIELESAAFSEGRFVRSAGGIIRPMIHITDHLGSVRAVVDGLTGQTVETNDYYPFGSRWEDEDGISDPTNRYRFNGKEDQEGEFGVPTLDYGARHYTPSSARWLSMDPLAEKYYGISPYALCNNDPVNFVDLDGMDGIYINFPDYKINVGIPIPWLGHSGVLLIDNKTGVTKYYEYGRYDKAKIGIVRNREVPNVEIGKDGFPTTESLNNVLYAISAASGHGGRIEGAYVKSDQFEKMNNFAQSMMSENNNPDRDPYNLLNNNCSTFAEDVLKQDNNVKENVKNSTINRPNAVVKKWKLIFTPINFNPKN